MNKPTRFLFKAHGKQFVLASEHDDYVAFLKAEFEVQNQRIDRRDEDVGRLYCENARLKAEVERLTFDPLTYLDDQGEWMPRHIHLAAVERLKAEVERLRKAGDAMVEAFDLKYPVAGGVIKAWKEAKEGKQS